MCKVGEQGSFGTIPSLPDLGKQYDAGWGWEFLDAVNFQRRK